MNRSNKNLTNKISNQIQRKSFSESKKDATSYKKSSLLDKSPLVKDQIGQTSSIIQKNMISKASNINDKIRTNFIQRNKSLTKFKKNFNKTEKEPLKKSVPLLVDKNQEINRLGKFFKKYNLTKKISKSKSYSFLKRFLKKLNFDKLIKKNVIVQKKERLISISEDTESLIEGSKSEYSINLSSFRESIKSLELKYSIENDAEIWEIPLRINNTIFSSLSLETIKEISLIDQVEVKSIKVEIDNSSLKLNDHDLKNLIKGSDFNINSIKNQIKSNSEPNFNFLKSYPKLLEHKGPNLYAENKNNNHSDNSEIISINTNLSASDVSKNHSGQAYLNNDFEENVKNLYEIHREILNKYLLEDQKNNLSHNNSEISKDFVTLPSLFDKHGANLIQLFSIKTDKSFLPSYVDPRLIGEFLYQLDQRIFNYIFGINPLNRRDISNGYQPLDFKSTFKNLILESKKNRNNKKKISELLNRHKYLTKSFKEIGYRENFHPNIMAFLIMKYGLYPCLPIDFQIKYKNFCQFELLFRILIKNLDHNETEYVTILYLCLLLMAFDDQEPIFRFQ